MSVAPDTLIITDKGICKIGDVVGKESYDKCDLMIYGVDCLSKTSRYCKKSPVHTNKIILKYGFNIECSLDHPLMSRGLIYKKKRQCWKRVADIDVGDEIAVQYNQQCYGNNNKIECDYKDPEFTSGLAMLLGMIVSSSVITDQDVTISISKPAIIDKILNSNLTFSACDKGVVSKSASLQRLIKWLGITSRKIIPPQILACSKEILISFINGIFVNVPRYQFGKCVYYSSSDKEFINQLRVVLTNAGIVTRSLNIGADFDIRSHHMITDDEPIIEWMPVEKIVYSTSETIDIEVPESHTLTTNGIISHN